MAEAITFDLPEINWRPPTASPLDGEIRAFERLLPELLQTHRGRYVAVLGGRVIVCGADKIAVAKQAYAEHGYRPILVRLVTDQPRPVVHIPSVRRAANR